MFLTFLAVLGLSRRMSFSRAALQLGWAGSSCTGPSRYRAQALWASSLWAPKLRLLRSLRGCGEQVSMLHGVGDLPNQWLNPCLLHCQPESLPWATREALYCIFLIHSSVDGCSGCCFHVLALVNNAAMNTGVYVSFWSTVFSGRMARSEIAGAYGNSVFNCLRKPHAALYSGCTNLHL